MSATESRDLASQLEEAKLRVQHLTLELDESMRAEHEETVVAELEKARARVAELEKAIEAESR